MVTSTRQRPAVRKPLSAPRGSEINTMSGIGASTDVMASKSGSKSSNVEQRHLNTIWVDRIERELRCQRQWESKWGTLNDPKLYGGEKAPDRYATKEKPTKWGAFSVINPPRHNPAISSNSSTPASSRPSSARANMHNDQISMKEKIPTSTIPKQNQASLASYRFATGTSPDQRIASTGLTCSPHGPSLSFRSHLHPLKHTSLHENPPMETYKFPATTSQTYGWAWNGRVTLEIYGSTSCNYRALTGRKATGSE